MTEALTGPRGVDDIALVTQAEYARRRGCSREAVRKQVDAGKIDAVGPNKLICPRIADVQWAERVRARADGAKAAPGQAAIESPSPTEATGQAMPPEKPGAGADLTYADARRRREHADAERAELETAQLAGRLVDRKRVEAAVFDAFRVLRDRVMATPRRCAPGVLGLLEVREVELAIADELRRALGLAPDDVDAARPAAAIAIVDKVLA